MDMQMYYSMLNNHQKKKIKDDINVSMNYLKNIESCCDSCAKVKGKIETQPLKDLIGKNLKNKDSDDIEEIIEDIDDQSLNELYDMNEKNIVKFGFIGDLWKQFKEWFGEKAKIVWESIKDFFNWLSTTASNMFWYFANLLENVGGRALIEINVVLQYAIENLNYIIAPILFGISLGLLLGG